MPPEFPVIRYEQIEVGGIPVRPNSREVLLKAVAGHTIEVLDYDDYINLYQIFVRLQSERPKLRKLKMVQRQVGLSLWRIFLPAHPKEVPEPDLMPGYNPKRGRYKRYAERLAAGDILAFSKKREAIKARQAWQLYVEKKDRKHLRPNIRKNNRGQFEARIVERVITGDR